MQREHGSHIVVSTRDPNLPGYSRVVRFYSCVVERKRCQIAIIEGITAPRPHLCQAARGE